MKSHKAKVLKHTIFLLLLPMTFLSCTDSDELKGPNVIDYKNLILGDWEYYTQEYSDRGDLPYLVNGCAADIFYRFNSDGTEDRYDYDFITSNTSENYEEDGYMLRKYTCSGDFGFKGSRKYEIVEDRIYWTNPDGTESISTIEKLDKTTLIIQWNSDAEYFSKWKYRVVFNRK